VRQPEPVLLGFAEAPILAQVAALHQQQQPPPSAPGAAIGRFWGDRAAESVQHGMMRSLQDCVRQQSAKALGSCQSVLLPCRPPCAAQSPAPQQGVTLLLRGWLQLHRCPAQSASAGTEEQRSQAGCCRTVGPPHAAAGMQSQSVHDRHTLSSCCTTAGSQRLRRSGGILSSAASHTRWHPPCSLLAPPSS
jgi:hypothetical protein